MSIHLPFAKYLRIEAGARSALGRMSRSLLSTLLVIGACVGSTLSAEELPVPRSDASVLNVDFENYTDGVVQALNAGVRWLGDPFSGRKEGRTSITEGFAFSGNRAGHAATTAGDEIGRIRLQARYDAPPVNGDSVLEFVFRPVRDEPVELHDFQVFSGAPRAGGQAGLILHATSTDRGQYALHVTHASSDVATRSSDPIAGLPQDEWIRVILHRQRSSGTVELFVGPPGHETSRGVFGDLNPLASIAKVELGDPSTSTSYGSG